MKRDLHEQRTLITDHPNVVTPRPPSHAAPAAVPPSPPPAPEARPPAEVIDNRFRIEGELGQGGMGIVYHATQLSIGRPVALKLLRAEHAKDEATVQRFIREASSIARLSHPNIVTMLDFGKTSSGELYIAMEYIKGESLADRLEKTGWLAPSIAVSIATQILAALENAHGQGIIHRDLKPTNVMLVNADGLRDMVKLLDFGVAKLFDELQADSTLTRTGVVVGTPAYMSPEQAMGDPVDGRTDLYAVGLILYEMLTGTRPFFANTTRESLLQRITQPPRAIEDGLRKRMPPRVYDALMRALARDPKQRYESAREMRHALTGNDTSDQVAYGLSRDAARAGAFNREVTLPSGEIVASRRPRRLLVGVLSGVAAVAVSVAVTLAVMKSDAPTKRTEVSAAESAPAPVPVAASAPAPAPAPGISNSNSDSNSNFPGPAPGRLEARGLRLEARDTRVLPQAPGLKSHAFSPPPAAARATATPTPKRVEPRRRTHTALKVRVRCANTGQLCWASIALDDGEPRTTTFASFRARPGAKLFVQKDGFKTVRRVVKGTRDVEEITVDLHPNP